MQTLILVSKHYFVTLRQILIMSDSHGQFLETLSLLNGGNGWTRTNHTQIFSLLLYLMSYVADYWWKR